MTSVFFKRTRNDAILLTSYEQIALRDIRAWEQAKPGFVMKTIDSIGNPVALILEKVPMPFRGTVERTVIGFMEMLKDISYWTYSEKSIIKKGRRHGLQITRISDLVDQDLETLDFLAGKHFSSSKIIAALEGAGCGMGGLMLVAADIPVLMGIMFRSIQQIGSCYGFSMQDPAMLHVVMSIYNAGTTDSATVKSSVLADMQIAAFSMAGKSAYLKAATMTKSSLVVNFLEKSTGYLPAQIAKNMSKRKLAQLVPIFGAAIGAGLNYWLMNSTLTAAYMIFRKLHIERRLASAAAMTTAKPAKRRLGIIRFR